MAVTGFTLLVFAIVTGFTLSGIVASLYRILGVKPSTRIGRAGHVAVMVLAGPSVLFENAARAVRAKKTPAFYFWIAAAICAYWSLALGLLVLRLLLAA